ncbi:hypothetical protein glysoja_024642 [Glycine soja]|uniref:Uncharacterized protein n=1 Tax=Glycine soja TaxID=3848 RepID=A0A0B2P905_GLYSO|nr:hypothetical protein glysoja_024642 [Glycine soja]
MKDCWFFYNNFNGLSDESLDDVMDMEFLDLPLDFEDVETDAVEEQDWDAQFNKFLEDPPPPLGSFPLQSSEFCGQTQHENVKLGKSFRASVSFLPSFYAL